MPVNKIGGKLNIDLYKKLYLIRRAEQGIIDNYASDAMKTPMHMSMGEEAIVAGVCQALKKNDQVLGTYRSHALYLAKTGDVTRFFAEMYGKVTGVADGKAGSMHLSSPENGYLMSSAIVATTIPVAVGVAYANKLKKNNAMTAVFFGDGATEGGVFWESLNFACLKKLPMLFVCEDNELAVHTDLQTRHGYDSLDKIVSQFNCLSFKSSSTDAGVIHEITVKAIQEARSQQKTVFLHFDYYRYLEHVGINEDFDAGYRARKDFLKWQKKDPVWVGREKLIASGLSEARVGKIEREIDERVTRAISEAEEAEFPARKELYANVFHGEKK